MVREASEPRLLEEVHVAVENVASERRVGEYVVDGGIRKIQRLGGTDLVVHLRPGHSAAPALAADELVRSFDGGHFTKEQIEDVPFEEDRRDVVVLVRRV